MALTDNRAALEALRDQANALPDAGSGGGAPETCTVEISDDSFRGISCHIVYTDVGDGVAQPQYAEYGTSVYDSISVIKGSIITIAGTLTSTTGTFGVNVPLGEEFVNVVSIENNVASVYVCGDCCLGLVD